MILFPVGRGRTGDSEMFVGVVRGLYFKCRSPMAGSQTRQQVSFRRLRVGGAQAGG